MQQPTGASVVGHKKNIAEVLDRGRIFLDLLANSGRAWPGTHTKPTECMQMLLKDVDPLKLFV